MPVGGSQPRRLQFAQDIGLRVQPPLRQFRPAMTRWAFKRLPETRISGRYVRRHESFAVTRRASVRH